MFCIYFARIVRIVLAIIQPHVAILRDSLVSVARRVLSSSVDGVSLHCLSVVPRAIQLCCLFLAMNWHAGDWLNKRVESMICGSSAATSQWNLYVSILIAS